MRIVIFSRYPRFDKMAWKENALRRFTYIGIKPVGVIFSDYGFSPALKQGLKRYGVKGMLSQNEISDKNQVTAGNRKFSRKLKLVAKELKIPVFNVRSHNDMKCKKILKELQPDLILLWGTGIIKKDILEMPKIGTLNGHYAILPKIRGMSVTEWALLLNEEAGITIHFVTPGVDLGDILYTKKIQVDSDDTLDSIRVKCQNATSEGFVEVVHRINENEHRPIRQFENEGRQYFVMNPFLKNILIKKLKSM